jgi:arylsulfatase A-like enzyme
MIEFFRTLGLALGGLIAVVLGVAVAVLVFKRLLRLLPPILAKLITFALKLGVVAALFTLIFDPAFYGLPEDTFGGITPQQLWEELKKLDLAHAAPWFAFAAVAKLCGIFAGIIRWRILLRGQGVHIPFWYLVVCWFWGRAIGTFLPGTLGLDGYRLVESSRYTGEVVKCTTVIFVEKLTGFIALFTLVFFTLPLAQHVLGGKINMVVMGVVLAILAGFILVSLLLLLQPRVIQVVAAVLPLPGKVKAVVNKLGSAVTAYGSNRSSLFAALFFGLLVHVGMVFMYFGTATALKAQDTDLLDILFASPLIIVGSVFAPTVSGVGVREIVMTTVLGPTAGEAKAFLFGHLGLWFDSLVPLILSLPLLLFTTRPDRARLQGDIEKLREQSARQHVRRAHLSLDEIGEYRGRVFGTILSGLFAGLLAGAIIGLAEAGYLYRYFSDGLPEVQSFFWAPIAYGLIFAAAGVGVSAGLLFLYLLFDRFAKGIFTLAISFGATLAVGAGIIGMFRYGRDFLAEQGMGMQDFARVGLFALGVGMAGMALLYFLTVIAGRLSGRNGYVMMALGCAAFSGLVGGGYLAAERLQPVLPEPSFTPAAQPATGPNVFLIAIDTLRADHLKAFNPEAPTTTPNFDALSRDAVTFRNAYSQASWTKASFGTIFSGLYPECHTATGKASSLPDGVETVAELMQAGGYYTQGYSNNPNIMSAFNYDQGFVEYVDLKPSYLFGGTRSVFDLSMYQVLRKVRSVFISKIPNFLATPKGITLFHQRFELPNTTIPVHALKPKIIVTEYYQPAEVVTDTALGWLDSGRVPKGNPLFLFTHYMDPHDPFMDPDSPNGGWARNMMGDKMDPEKFREPMHKAYIREIEHLDIHLGRFIAGLKERRLYDNSLIVLTADHGEEFCEHGGWWHGQTLYNEQIHVPMMVKLPGNVNAGTGNVFIARNLDLAPTILQAAGLAKGSMMQGQPLFDTNGTAINQSIGYSYAENNFEGIVLQSVSNATGGKVIKANEGNKRGLAPVSLFDLSTDPTEQTNRAGDTTLAGIETELLNLIDGAYAAKCEQGAVEPSAPAPAAAGGETQEQLESLGYLN